MTIRNVASRKPKNTLNVLFCSSEVAPFAKTGGLADVAGSLPAALASRGAKVLVLMPRYRGVDRGPVRLAEGAEIRFLENEELFNRAGLYGNEAGDYPDNLKRFAWFCNEALVEAKNLGFKPDVVHVNDWQTALVPVLLKTRFAGDAFFENARTLMTVHNLAYQGLFPQRLYPELGLDPTLYSMDGFEFYGKVCLLKAGILFADGVSTVSPTYAREILTKEFGAGLEGVIQRRADALRGILNGLDYGVWDPAKDKTLAERYSVKDPAGKAACKAALQKECGLPADPKVPLFGMVTRLVDQKGLDILSEAIDRILALGAQFVLLGEGEPVYKTTFANVAKRNPKQASVHLGFDAAESHRIYAGSDFFLMPSYFEPCGLGQLISLKYGTLPVVRRTGGLADTIVDADQDAANGNGFSFKDRSPEKLLDACERALRAFREPARLEALRARAMAADFSWGRSADEYLGFFEALRARRAAGEERAA